MEKCDFCPPHQKNVPKTYSIRKHTHAIFSRLTGYAVRLFECQLWILSNGQLNCFFLDTIIWRVRKYKMTSTFLLCFIHYFISPNNDKSQEHSPIFSSSPVMVLVSAAICCSTAVTFVMVKGLHLAREMFIDIYVSVSEKYFMAITMLCQYSQHFFFNHISSPTFLVYSKKIRLCHKWPFSRQA